MPLIACLAESLPCKMCKDACRAGIAIDTREPRTVKWADKHGNYSALLCRTPFNVETKADASPVTIADKEAETAMRDLLTQVAQESTHHSYSHFGSMATFHI